MPFNARLLALVTVYFNIFICIVSICFLLSMVLQYTIMDDQDPDLLDDYVTKATKELPNVMVFMWLVMEIAGIFICLRCIKGINEDIIQLVAQYLVWSAAVVISFALTFILVIVNYKNTDSIAFPLPCFSVNLFLFISVYLFYRQFSAATDER